MLLIKTIEQFTQKELSDYGIKGLCFDSKIFRDGDLFCALPGIHNDGHDYIVDMRSAGCRHFLVSDSSYDQEGEFHILTDDTRQAMAQLSSIFYGVPSQNIKVIGVTGTDGKSTTSHFIQQLLETRGHPCGLISTISFKTTCNLENNLLRQSTPEAPQVEKALRTMVNNGLEYAVLEATSHGLSENTARLKHIEFKTGVFTNVTIEHLEFHKTLDCYRQDKANLFRQVQYFHPHDGFGVINGESDHKDIYRKACGDIPVYFYGVVGSSLWAENIRSTARGISLSLCCLKGKKLLFFPIFGSFNVENMLAAVLCVSHLLKLSPLAFVEDIQRLKGIPGRMKVLKQEPYMVIVDYAHTPGAFEKILPEMKVLTSGKFIVMFGSGGERDIEKRPLQGQLADRYADVIVLTDEDPRWEDEDKILRDIAEGIKHKIMGKNMFCVRPRREAIKKCFLIAKPGDTVMLLGKGHESCIIIGEDKTPWDEEGVALEIFSELSTEFVEG